MHPHDNYPARLTTSVRKGPLQQRRLRRSTWLLALVETSGTILAFLTALLNLLGHW